VQPQGSGIVWLGHAEGKGAAELNCMPFHLNNTHYPEAWQALYEITRAKAAGNALAVFEL